MYYLLAFAAGVAGVIQSGLNRKIAEKTGLALALHIGNLVVLIGAILVLSTVTLLGRSELARISAFKVKFTTDLWHWWFVIPGLMGLFFIIVSPIAIGKIGALRVFIGLITAQVIASLLWDKYVEHLPVDVW